MLAADVGELTLVFDAGQNSADNVELVEDSPLHFVGSLPPSDHPDLLAVPRSATSPSTRRAFLASAPSRPRRSSSASSGASWSPTRRTCTTSSPGASTRPSAKARRQLTELAARLARGNTRKSREKVEAEIEAILKPRWLSRVISTTLVGESPAELRLTWRTKPTARQALEDELFGKRILFTDKDRAPKAVIVADYRSQSDVEGDFRQMKDPHVVSFSPMFHWTDHKIRVHVFSCVLALTVARLMVREADRHGIHMSVRELLDTLAGIQETVLLYQGERGRPRARRMLTEIDPTQQRLYDLFGLDAYAPAKP